MDVAQFDFELPEGLIALRPAQPRESARLLVVRADGSLEHRRAGDLPELLSAGDMLVVNDTKVIAARLRGRRMGRGPAAPKIELMLHKRVDAGTFQAFSRPARKLLPDDRVLLGVSLEGTIVARGAGGECTVRFDLEGAELDRAIAATGETPLPPYIAGKRRVDAQDLTDYQTVFAAHEGSVAAPTASLHFTPDLLAGLAEKDIGRETVTLHVGAGTFLPVSVADTKDHRMHSEWAQINAASAAAMNAARAQGGRLVAAGTTSLRTLESAATPEGALQPFVGETDIFITPGYRFRTAEVLLTNFHLPRSTLFMLVSAFSGQDVMRAAYAEAIRERYRFYSYGDACLLFRSSS